VRRGEVEGGCGQAMLWPAKLALFPICGLVKALNRVLEAQGLAYSPLRA